MNNPRINRELAKINKNPPKGISVCMKDDDIRVLEAAILGPDDTPYRNGTFFVEVILPETYPFQPPSIKFITKIYHPNIDDQGRICLDLLKMPPKGSWNPTMTIEGLLIAVRMLLETPNPTDPLMAEVADEFLTNPKEFERKAEEYCNKHARGVQI